jgi:hypothetical protein
MNLEDVADFFYACFVTLVSLPILIYKGIKFLFE